MSAESTIRRVPLRSLWIKGIRTVWHVRWQLLAVWILTMLLPLICLEYWTAPKASEMVDQLRSLSTTSQGGKLPVIVQIIGLLSPFMAAAFASYFATFSLGAFGWILTLHIVHRYFGGFPPFSVARLTRISMIRLVFGSYLILAIGAILGFGGIVGFPIMDILSAIVLMVPVYQIATDQPFFRSCHDALRLNYASHFRGGRFLALVQLALLSIVVSTGIVGFVHGFEWLLNMVADWLAINGMLKNELPLVNQFLAVARNSLIGLLLILLAAYQMTLYFWLFSIPKMLPHNTMA